MLSSFVKRGFGPESHTTKIYIDNSDYFDVPDQNDNHDGMCVLYSS